MKYLFINTIRKSFLKRSSTVISSALQQSSATQTLTARTRTEKSNSINTRSFSSDKRSDQSDNSLVTFTHDPSKKIGYITLNSPSTYNALSEEMGQEFESLIHQLTSKLNDHDKHQSQLSHDDDSNIKNVNVIILQGADRNFSSGGDLNWLRSLRNNPVHINADKMYSFYKSFLSIRSLPVPTIAHIEGYAIGAGACLALATDLRVMDEKAKIGFNFVKLGIHSGMGGSHLLSNAIGESRSKFALLTGKVFNAQEAFENGIAHDISKKKNDDVGEEEDDKVVMDIAEKIASMHPLAVRSMVQTTRIRENAMGGIGGLDATMRKEAYAQALCYAKNDWGEGLDAIVEKRQPNFSNYHESD